MLDYGILLDKICKASGLQKEEVEKKVDAKRDKLSGLISREGAAQIVAAELGISFENEKSKVNELRDGMKGVNVAGKIIRLFPVREFNKNGREGKVASFFLADETSSVRVALWDLNHISLIEKQSLKEGDVVSISRANVRNGEMHLSGFSDIKKSTEKMEDISIGKGIQVEIGMLKDVKEGASLRVRAFFVQSFEPKYFESKKKEGERGVLLNTVIDDGTNNLRAVLFGENIKKLFGVSDDELFSAEVLNEKVKQLPGEEKMLSGYFRMNSFTNNVEMTVNDIEDVDIDALVKELEAKI